MGVIQSTKDENMYWKWQLKQLSTCFLAEIDSEVRGNVTQCNDLNYGF